MKVIVIGAGILGLTAAYQLTGRGHAVVLLDQEGPFAGSSHRSFAWINANNKFPSAYHLINSEGIEEHVRLQAQLESNRTWFHQFGSVLVDFGGSRTKTYATRVEHAEAEGYPVERLDRDRLHIVAPAIHWPLGLDSALYYPLEGWLDNDVLGHEQVRILHERGVPVQQARVSRVNSDHGGGVVRLDGGAEMRADAVVIATGAWSRELGAASGYVIPVADLSSPSPRTHSLLGLTEPTNLSLRTLMISDRVNVRPRHDGRLWVQIPPLEARVSEAENPTMLAEVAAAMENELRHLFARQVAMEKVIVSGRSFPEDGHSIIGFLDEHRRVYVNVTHSGMTLAPLFARLTADELEGGDSTLLVDFRPSRFAEGDIQLADFDYYIGRQ